jgi:hypothetical protein
MSGLALGNYLTENELIPGQHARGPWLTMNEVRPQFVSHPTRHHQSFGGLGAPDELALVRAERAQIDAEIERLQKGGRPVVGGFQPRPAQRQSPAQIAAAQAAAQAEARAASVKRRVVSGGLFVVGVVAFFALRKSRIL